MTSLLQVGMSQGSAVPATLQWLIAVGVLVYLLYKVYYMKEEAFQNLMSGTSALLIVFIFLALANVSEGTLAGFGPLTGGMKIVLTLVRSVILGSFFAVIASYAQQIIQAEKSKPGF